jgi:hypothetical protein
MAKHAGYARWVYNWGLRMWSQGYKEGLKPSDKALNNCLPTPLKLSILECLSFFREQNNNHDNQANLGN